MMMIVGRLHIINCEHLLFTYRAVDHQWDGSLFATAGAQVDIWDHNRFGFD